MNNAKYFLKGLIIIFGMYFSNIHCQSNYNAGNSSTAGFGIENTTVGASSGNSSSTGDANSFFGFKVGESLTSGAFNAFYGVRSGSANTTGRENSFFGYKAGEQNVSGRSNSFFGYRSGVKNVTDPGTPFGVGDYNSFFGSESGSDNISGDYNSFFGSGSGRNNTSGRSNSFFGRASGSFNQTGNENSFFGNSSGGLNSIGNENSFLGNSSGLSNTEGNRNVFVGHSAGFYNTSGSYNISIGRYSGTFADNGDGNIFIGNSAGPSFDNKNISNKLYIENKISSGPSPDDNPLIYGEFDNDFVKVNGTFEVTSGLSDSKGIIVDKEGRFGIGTNSPEAELHTISHDRLAELKVESSTGTKIRMYAFKNSGSLSGTTGIASITPDPLFLGTNRISAMEIDTDQNISIYKNLEIDGTLEVKAGLTNPSSRSLKQHFVALDASSILAKLATLNIQQWTYIHCPDEKHVGPVAEDFYALFGLGDGDKKISTIDADGIMMLAIQALKKENEQLKKELENIKRLLTQD